MIDSTDPFGREAALSEFDDEEELYSAAEDEDEWEGQLRRSGRRGRRARPARRRVVSRPSRPRGGLRRPLGRGGRPGHRPGGHRPSGKPDHDYHPRPRPPRGPVWGGRRRHRLVRHRAAPCICPAHGEEFVRWVQSTLNQTLGLSLPVNGVMNAASRDALRDFQRRRGLPDDGIAGPDTERALMEARQGGAAGGSTADGAPQPAASEFEALFGEVMDNDETEDEAFLGSLWPFSSSPNIIDRTAHSPKSKRHGTRDINKVYALVLHQTAFSRGSDPTRYDNVTSHFVIVPDGKIIQLHPETAYLYSSNGFNHGSVAVEFAGNFPNTHGRWWNGDRFGRNQVTPAQISSGRALIRYLIKTIGLTHVLAHRQSSGTRTNDPGPDIWKGVGQWAVDTLGLKDGGPGFKVGTGKPIPDEWRNWNR